MKHSNNFQPLWKTVWKFLKKLNMHLPYDPAIPLLGIYLREMNTYVLVFYCCRNELPHTSQLKQHLLSQCAWVSRPGRLGGVLGSGSHKAKVKASAGLCSLEALGKDPLQAYSGCWQSSVPGTLGLGSPFPRWLSVPYVGLIPYHIVPSIFNPAVTHGVLLWPSASSLSLSASSLSSQRNFSAFKDLCD